MQVGSPKKIKPNMRNSHNNWLFFMHLDGLDPYLLPSDPLISNGLGLQLLSHVGSVVENSLHPVRCILVPGGVALREAFSCIFKLAGAFIWCSGASNFRSKLPKSHASKQGSSNSSQLNLRGFKSCSRIPHEHLASLFCQKVSSFSIKHLFKRDEKFQSVPVLSLAAALIPPLDNLASSILGIPPGDAEVQMLDSVDQRPCNVERRGCVNHPLPDLNWVSHTIEPKTGIEFPGILDNILAKENQSSLSSEVLVGTGSRTMTIIKIKTLKVYAFGFYVHPYSACQKLGPKYASVPVSELKERNDFYEDLLREDIGMTIRFVVNCNGMKINAVKDAFEKSLRARLVKTNPETDFKCIATFGSYFTNDIPLPAGTTIDFRRTADGQLITEIGGNHIGAVHSRDLCRAFFDMYIGEVPVSEQTKEEIGRNVASIIGRC